MTFLNSHEREVMTLRFIEQWEYNEIAAAQVIPLGTVKWTVFNAKKKLAPHLKTRQNGTADETGDRVKQPDASAAFVR
jgi:DNA-directed RNA polymerase specialized sigma24 family protein